MKNAKQLSRLISTKYISFLYIYINDLKVKIISCVALYCCLLLNIYRALSMWRLPQRRFQSRAPSEWHSVLTSVPWGYQNYMFPTVCVCVCVCACACVCPRSLTLVPSFPAVVRCSTKGLCWFTRSWRDNAERTTSSACFCPWTPSLRPRWWNKMDHRVSNRTRLSVCW